MKTMRPLKSFASKGFRIFLAVLDAVFFEKRISANRNWDKVSYTLPAPQHIKHSCVMRNSLIFGNDFTFVETGTYIGDTTALFESVASKVFSIEPDLLLYQQACSRFKSSRNIEVIHGTSEDVFPVLIPKLKGNIVFWLDGHFSEGITYKGKKDTPIMEELSEIAKHLSSFSAVVIMIDDIRVFDPIVASSKDYPTRSYLVQWADKNSLTWIIEHDIFIARS